VRVMRTEYRIDAFQQSYFVVDSFEELFEACYGTDFAPLYRQHAAQPAYPADAVLPGDRPGSSCQLIGLQGGLRKK